jgi:hypothetical protein
MCDVRAPEAPEIRSSIGRTRAGSHQMIRYAAGLSLLALTCACGRPVRDAGAGATAGDLDPVRLAPQIYATKLENEHVRAILTTARPGEFTPMHAHPGRVAVFLDDCVERRAKETGETVERKFAAGEVLWAPAEIHGDFKYSFLAECRIVEVEVKGAE